MRDVLAKLLYGAGLPENLVLFPPSTPEGMNEQFATEFYDKIRGVRDEKLGDRPALRMSTN